MPHRESNAVWLTPLAPRGPKDHVTLERLSTNPPFRWLWLRVYPTFARQLRQAAASQWHQQWWMDGWMAISIPLISYDHVKSEASGYTKVWGITPKPAGLSLTKTNLQFECKESNWTIASKRRPLRRPPSEQLICSENTTELETRTGSLVNLPNNLPRGLLSGWIARSRRTRLWGCHCVMPFRRIFTLFHSFTRKFCYGPVI